MIILCVLHQEERLGRLISQLPAVAGFLWLLPPLPRGSLRQEKVITHREYDLVIYSLSVCLVGSGGGGGGGYTTTAPKKSASGFAAAFDSDSD